MKFVIYYRVSTKRQGKSGLGLDAQRAVIDSFLTFADVAVAEFVEITSGKDNERVELTKAIALARKTGSRLLIAKLDRFSRRVSFIANMMESDVSLTIAEMPTATEFQLHIFAALAQEERRLISERTKAALIQAKRRGVKLGANGKKLAVANANHADEFAQTVLTHLQVGWQNQTLTEIASHLNSSGVKTFRGGRFFPQTVKNLTARIEQLKALN